MGLGGAGGRTGAGRAFDRAKVEPPGFCESFESRQNITRRAHVAGFFLNPDYLARIGMFCDGGGNFRARQRIELVEKENGGVGVLAAAAFGAQLVPDFSTGDQDAAGVLHFAVGNQGQEARLREILDVRAGVGMAQHALGREDDEWLAPQTARLPAQHVEILRGRGWLANLHVIFTRADELVDDHLRAVGKITELRFPQNERLGIVAAETVFKTEATGLGKRRVVNLAESLLLGKMREREVVVLRFRVNEHGVALAERAALRILPREAYGIALEKYGAERQHFGKTIIDGTLAMPHFRALFEKLRDFRMEVKSLRHANEAVGDFREFFLREAGIDLIFGFVAAVLIGGPVFRQFAQVRYFSYCARLGLLLFVFLADSLNHQGGVHAGVFGVNFPQRSVIL